MLWFFAVVAIVAVIIRYELASRPPRLDPTLPTPISDDEFVRRLSPEVPPEVGLKVREIIAEALSIDKTQIYPDTRLRELMPDEFPSRESGGSN